MKNASSVDLYEELLKVIARIQNDVDYRRSLNNYLPNAPGPIRKQRPAMSVGAECNGATGIGHQHVTAREDILHKAVYNALIKNYGQLNVLDNASGNYVGHCAENYAATSVLDQLQGSVKFPASLSDIGFTDAFCPRTGQMKDWCSICHTIFD